MQRDSYYTGPAPIERIIAALSYVNCLIGLIWLIIAALMKRGIRPFLQFHIYQSIFIAFAIFIVGAGLALVMKIINFIPIINNIVSIITFYLNTPIIMGYSVVNFLIFLVLMYLALGALMGRFSYFPWVSDIIKGNIRG